LDMVMPGHEGIEPGPGHEDYLIGPVNIDELIQRIRSISEKG